jgi:alpha/beta superfamily hydrolase
MTDLSGNTFFEGPAGRIEAIIKEPATVVTRAAIVCHPHPLFGGTMHNKVVFRIARSFQNAGFAVLRFNFRGAGRSEGEHDNGRGEQEDLQAGIKFIERKYADAELWLAGFSFGSAVMLRAAVCDDLDLDRDAHGALTSGRVRAIVATGVPVSSYDLTGIAKCGKPKLFIQGSLDKYGSVEDLERLFATLDEPKELKIIQGADHFFEGHLTELEHTISSFVAAVGRG